MGIKGRTSNRLNASIVSVQIQCEFEALITKIQDILGIVGFHRVVLDGKYDGFLLGLFESTINIKYGANGKAFINIPSQWRVCGGVQNGIWYDE